MSHQITEVRIPAQRVLSVRSRVPEADVPEFVGTAFAEIYGLLRDRSVEPSGHPSVLYHEFGAMIDVEAAVPVDVDVPTEGRIAVVILPGTTVVRTLHVGPYERLGDTYAELTRWISDRDLAPAGPVREHYLTGIADGVAPEDYRTVIEMPVMPVAALTG